MIFNESKKGTLNIEVMVAVPFFLCKLTLIVLLLTEVHRLYFR